MKEAEVITPATFQVIETQTSAPVIEVDRPVVVPPCPKVIVKP